MKLGVACLPFIACLSGCPGAVTPEAVGAGVLTFAEANRVLATACGEAAVFVGTVKGRDAGQIVLDKCEANHTRVRAAMLVFADGVDAWRKGKAGPPACAAADARMALLDSLDFSRSVGANVSPRVDDFVSFFTTIVSNATLGECKR